MILRSGTIALLHLAFGLALHAAPCDMDPGAAAQRVFARVDAQHAWTEYKSIESVPSLSLEGGISAQIWPEPKGALLVRTVEPGEDFRSYTQSCFSKSSYLVYVKFELRTAWGWYYRAEGPIVMGRFHRSTEQYFDSKTGQAMLVRPQQADDFPSMMIPRLWMRTGQLPFAELLQKRP
jgi:hypothetical protein